MVPAATIVTVSITLFICLALPVIVYLVYGVKNKGKGVWTAWLLGAAGFFVFQILLRSPILSVLSMTSWFTAFATKHYVWYCLLLALTAALFEAAGRYIAAKLMGKKLTYVRGLAAGLGHGSIEAMVIVGLTYINNLAYIIMINTGSFDAVIEQTAALGVDTTQLLMVKESLVSANPGIFLLAGYERVLTVILHIALSMIVCYFVSQKKDIVGVVACVLIHGTVDFIVALVNGMAAEYLGNVISASLAYIIIYTFLTAVAALSVIVIRRFRLRWATAA